MMIGLKSKHMSPQNRKNLDPKAPGIVPLSLPDFHALDTATASESRGKCEVARGPHAVAAAAPVQPAAWCVWQCPGCTCMQSVVHVCIRRRLPFAIIAHLQL